MLVEVCRLGDKVTYYNVDTYYWSGNNVVLNLAGGGSVTFNSHRTDRFVFYRKVGDYALPPLIPNPDPEPNPNPSPEPEPEPEPSPNPTVTVVTATNDGLVIESITISAKPLMRFEATETGAITYATT